MAQAFLHKHAPHMDSFSAGTQPAPCIDPVVIDVMSKIGIDISQNKPRTLTDYMISQTTLVNMGCMDKLACPAQRSSTIEWNKPDPKNKSVGEACLIRDQTERNVSELVCAANDRCR